MQKFFKKGSFMIIFLAIIAVGIFLRTYHFSDWLHFELDQSRDARIISEAVDEGIGNLPLLGPRAAGTSLRLGPMFYYMEYAGAKIFGGTPPAMAYSMLFFSILTLPLFYLFSKRYFSKNISLGLMMLFSVSLFMVMYSRFAWNPNIIPFFALLAFYSLLRAVDREETKRKLWLYVFAVAIAIVTQLHFLAFVAIPAISFVFLAIKRPNFKLKTWGVAALIIIVFYVPAAINDVKTGGGNVKEFIEAVTGKPNDEKHTLADKVIRNGTNYATSHFLILSGNEIAEAPKIDITNGLKLDIKCDDDCHSNILIWAFGALIFLAGVILIIKNLFKEKDPQRKDFLMLNSLWFFLLFGLFIPFSFEVSPRFYLLSAPLVFIFLGFIIRFLSKKIESRTNKLILLIVIILIFTASNLYYTKVRFNELSKASSESVKISPDRILKEKARVTLEQQYMIIDYMKNFHDKNGYPVYHHSDAQYRRSFVYHFEQLGILNDGLKIDPIFKNGNHFLILRTSSDQSDRTKKFLKRYDILETKDFGTMIAYHFKPKAEFITDTQQDFSSETKALPKPPRRYKWNEIFSNNDPGK